MLQLRHVGIYVKDLERVEKFYISVFSMSVVCSRLIQKDKLIEDILVNSEGEVKLSKLITEQGKINGYGDMLEIVQVNKNISRHKMNTNNNLFDIGVSHIGFAVDNIYDTVNKILSYGGSLVTDIHIMDNGNKCCFAKDIEGNYLELIERN